ncbi:alpha/beta hydrolase [Ralstonia sp. A12]|uniref:RBBP9/YdeN family alpha/beta hydrolase n=1 Tax=Ralstonia sp. A12 TaxID=1217052 RepID=UPI000574EF4A|nr:alpha/beta hydrolase [Ralstonia sp. A12]KHK57965.1 alpha/beta hydrolase [Ralstonia sp. A12]
MRTAPTVLILPGWQNSGPEHWQSRWERLHGDRRVEQREWFTPKRADWVAALEAAVSAAPGDVVLVAHSLGCVLTAHWAAASAHMARVCGALLVAPPQLGREDSPPELADFQPVPQQRLPFPATLIFSTNDPFSDAAWSRHQAEAWGAAPIDLGARGHINAESGLGDWPEARAIVAKWSKSPI